MLLGLAVSSRVHLSPPLVLIEESVEPRMSPAEVSGRVVEAMQDMERFVGRVEKPARVLGMTATTAPGIVAIAAGAGGMLPAPEGILWLVRAEETFTNPRGEGPTRDRQLRVPVAPRP